MGRPTAEIVPSGSERQQVEAWIDSTVCDAQCRGEVIGEPHRRHRGGESLTFLRTIEANVPPDLYAHLVMDIYGAQDGQCQELVCPSSSFIRPFSADLGLSDQSVERRVGSLTENRSVVARTAPPANSSRPAATTLHSETKTPNHSHRPSSPMKSSPVSNGLVCEFLTQD